MSNPLDDHLLALTAIITVGYQLVFFIVTYVLRFDKVTDFAGSTNFIILAIVTLTVGGAYTTRQIVVSALVIAWGVRLGGFLLYRILQWGEDRRFDEQRKSIAKLAVFWGLQAIWVWTVSLPTTVLNSKESSKGLTGLDYAGWVVYAIGLIIEAGSDQQKYNYKQSDDTEGWVDSGFWRWSRHPNFFGEMLVWWGLYLSAVNDFEGAEHIAVVGPIFITCLLLFVSGIPIQEKSHDKKYGNQESYWQYKRRTSVLIPLPPALYERLPKIVKTTLLLDFKLYNPGPPDDDHNSDDDDQKGSANEETELMKNKNRNNAGENAA